MSAAATARPAKSVASTQVALKALERVAERWSLKKSDLPLLLGGRSSRTIRHWYERPAEAPLPDDVLERISHIVSIYDGLHRLFGDSEYADRWISEPNNTFGAAPRELLLSGSFTALVDVRRYIDQALLL